MAGRVITFYSYKGGVGRSFALANTAVLLAEWGFRVLAVDWDIEAPGLQGFFKDAIKESKPGVLEFLDQCRLNAPRAAAEYHAPVTSTPAVSACI